MTYFELLCSDSLELKTNESEAADSTSEDSTNVATWNFAVAVATTCSPGVGLYIVGGPARFNEHDPGKDLHLIKLLARRLTRFHLHLVTPVGKGEAVQTEAVSVQSTNLGQDKQAFFF